MTKNKKLVFVTQSLALVDFTTSQSLNRKDSNRSLTYLKNIILETI